MDLTKLRHDPRATLPRKEVAELLGVDPRTVSKGIENGTIPAIKVGHRVLVLRTPLLAMLTGETTPQAAHQ